MIISKKLIRSKKFIVILGILLLFGSLIIGSIVISTILLNSENEKHTDYKLYLSFQIRDDVSTSPVLGLELNQYILGDFDINSSTQNHYFISHREYYEIHNESRFLWNENEINKTYIQDHNSQYVTFINYTVSGKIYQIKDPSQYFCIIKFSLWLWANGTWGHDPHIVWHLDSGWSCNVDINLIT